MVAPHTATHDRPTRTILDQAEGPNTVGAASAIRRSVAGTGLLPPPNGGTSVTSYLMLLGGLGHSTRRANRLAKTERGRPS